MLTQTDLLQIKQTFDEIINPIKKGIENLEKNDKQSQTEIASVKTEIASIKKSLLLARKDIHKLQKDPKIVVEFFDKEYLTLNERVERIEKYLDIPFPPH